MIIFSTTITGCILPAPTLWCALSQQPPSSDSVVLITKPTLGTIFTIAARLAHPDVPHYELTIPNIECTREGSTYLKAPEVSDLDPEGAIIARQIANKRLQPRLMVIASAEAIVDELTSRYTAGLAARGRLTETSHILVKAMVADAMRRLAADLVTSGITSVFIVNDPMLLPTTFREQARFVLSQENGAFQLTDLVSNYTRRVKEDVLQELVDA